VPLADIIARPRLDPLEQQLEAATPSADAFLERFLRLSYAQQRPIR
jgi:hypothetical protein